MVQNARKINVLRMASRLILQMTAFWEYLWQKYHISAPCFGEARIEQY